MDEKIIEILRNIQSGMDEIKTDIKDIKDTVNRIEATQNEDVVAILKRVDKNTKDLEKDVEFLAAKVGNHERILNRLGEN